MKRVAIYTRSACATPASKGPASLHLQRDLCERYVVSQARRGWHLVDRAEYVDDGESGLTLERPAFQRLLADIDAGHVDVVVVSTFTRLVRSTRDLASVIERVERLGVAFVGVKPSVSTDNAVDWLRLSFLLTLAEYEARNGADSMRAGVAL